jgi:hypothetical protein
MRLFLAIVFINLAGDAWASDPAIISDSGQWYGVSPDGQHLAALAERPDENCSGARTSTQGFLR